MAYSEEAWARRLQYSEQNTEDALELFKWLRLKSYKLIVNLPPEVWANTVYHPENGIMTMDDWLDVYESHVRDHLAQMRRIHEEWVGGEH